MSRGREKEPARSRSASVRVVIRLIAALAGFATVPVVVMPLASAGAAPVVARSIGVGAFGRVIGSHETPAIARHGSFAPLVVPQVSVPHQTNPDCTFNGNPNVVENVTPGASIAISCTGWPADDAIAAGVFSPLFLQNPSSAEIDLDLQYFESNAEGAVTTTVAVPNPFSASDPAAVCPPTPAQIEQGFLACGIALVDQNGNGTLAALIYVGQPLLGPPHGASAVGIAATPDGGGYWVAWNNGSVTFRGDAGSFGDASDLDLVQPITHIVATPDGLGYWLVAADGGVFAFGDASFYGSMGGRPLDRPVVDLAPTGDGKGYWLVAADGGVFAFGDASFYGSMGGRPLDRPVVGIAADPATGGYWLVAADGGVFAFHAPFFGSTGNLTLNRPVIGITATPDSGYVIVASDGGVFAFGHAAFLGSTGNLVLNKPISGIAADPAAGGYWLVGGDGGVFAFGRAGFYGTG